MLATPVVNHRIGCCVVRMGKLGALDFKYDSEVIADLIKPIMEPGTRAAIQYER